MKNFSECLKKLENPNFYRVFEIYKILESLFSSMGVSTKCLRCSKNREVLEGTLNEALKKYEVDPALLHEKSLEIQKHFALVQGSLKVKDECITLDTFADEIFKFLTEA